MIVEDIDYGHVVTVKKVGRKITYVMPSNIAHKAVFFLKVNNIKYNIYAESEAMDYGVTDIKHDEDGYLKGLPVEKEWAKSCIDVDIEYSDFMQLVRFLCRRGDEDFPDEIKIVVE